MHLSEILADMDRMTYCSLTKIVIILIAASTMFILGRNVMSESSFSVKVKGAAKRDCYMD